MTLKSALDDLTLTTLQAIRGLWGRLEYLAGLRTGGSYLHWGLTKVHGEEAAQRALNEAHRVAVSRILRTPINDLVQDAEESSKPQEVTPAAYLEKLDKSKTGLVPANPPGGAAKHLSSVLCALLSLEKTRRDATPPTS
jgi:hypothetical protein